MGAYVWFQLCIDFHSPPVHLESYAGATAKIPSKTDIKALGRATSCFLIVIL